MSTVVAKTKDNVTVRENNGKLKVYSRKKRTKEQLETENKRLRDKLHNQRTQLRSLNRSLLIKDRELRYWKEKLANNHEVLSKLIARIGV